VGGIPLADGTDEVGYIGALYGEPIEVVKCEAVDLEVPAGAQRFCPGLPDGNPPAGTRALGRLKTC
jgi:hypothetical protein